VINPFKKKYSETELALFDFLGNLRLFEKLSNEELALFVPFLNVRTYKQNEVVFFSSDPSHALYIMKTGEVSLNLNVNDKFEELAVMGPGHTFGDNSLLENTERIYTSIITSEKAELYVIPQSNLLDILGANLEIKAKIMTSFAELYNQYTGSIFKTYKSSFGFFELNKVYRDRA